jgi:hypothetical protein
MDNTPTSSFSRLPKWGQVLIALVAVFILLGGALWIGGKTYYQVRPLTSTPTDGQSATSSPDQAAFAQALASAHLQDDGCSYFVADDPSSDLSPDTLKQLGVGVCNLIHTKGIPVIQRPLALGFNSSYYAGDDAYNGVGIVKSDRTYLVSFSLYKDPNHQYQIALTHATILKTVNVSAVTAVPVQSSVGGSQLAQVTGTDASGKTSEEYFGESYGRYSDGSFSIQVVKNSDGSFSNRVRSRTEYDPVKVSFLVPYSVSVGETVGDRDSVIETQNKTSPIYHKAACGLEETYGDTAFYTGPVTININFGYSPTLHITTALQGYVPEQWGTIVSNVSFSDFKISAQTSKAYNSNAPVKMMTIGGYTVKHIGPITADRTCEYNYDQGDTYDMYQTVKNGGVVTFTVTNSAVDGEAQPDIQKIISQVLGTLTFSPR